jgi:hypothetical protein
MNSSSLFGTVPDAPGGTEETVLLQVGDCWIALSLHDWIRARARGNTMMPSTGARHPDGVERLAVGLIVDADRASALTAIPAAWWLAQARAGKVPCLRLGKYVRFSLPEVLEHARRRVDAASVATSQAASHKAPPARHAVGGRPSSLRRQCTDEAAATGVGRAATGGETAVPPIKGGSSARVPSTERRTGAPRSSHPPATKV